MAEGDLAAGDWSCQLPSQAAIGVGGGGGRRQEEGRRGHGMKNRRVRKKGHTSQDNKSSLQRSEGCSSVLEYCSASSVV